MKNEQPSSEEQPEGIEKTACIDALFVTPSGETLLLMCALEEWGVKGERLPNLQAKFNTYLAFILDGQFTRQYPDRAGKPIRILLRCNFTPPQSEQKFLEYARTQLLEPAGIHFQVQVKPIHVLGTLSSSEAKLKR